VQQLTIIYHPLVTAYVQLTVRARLTAVMGGFTVVTLRCVITPVLVYRLVYRDSAGKRHSSVVDYIVDARISNVLEVAVRHA
jgi:hypothetical protein